MVEVEDTEVDDSPLHSGAPRRDSHSTPQKPSA